MWLVEWLNERFSRRRRSPPRRLIIRDCAYALDGGTIRLEAQDEYGRQVLIMLAQHAMPTASRSMDLIPGRLYFQSRLIPIRSELEGQVVRLLETAEVNAPPAQVRPSGGVAFGSDDIRQYFRRTPEENCRALREEIVAFVRSERYVLFAAKVDPFATGRGS